MSRRSTYILGSIVVVAAIAAIAAFAHMRHQQVAADAQQADLRQTLRLLDELQKSGKSSGRIAMSRLDGGDLNRRIREAATNAGISDRLASIEPNRPARLGESDYNELMVFVRFDNVNLRQLGGFMHRLSAIDPGCRIKSIELEAPPEASEDQRWTSDLTLAYLSYAPRETGKGEGQ